jgi:predicted proteasome-type protease
MKNIVFILIFATCSCQNSMEKKANCSEFDFFNHIHSKLSTPSPIDYKVYTDSNYSDKIVKLEEVDTLYRFRHKDGWSNFDYLCSLYKKNDSSAYQIQLLRSEFMDRFYSITTKTLDTSDWVKFSHKIITANFWC